MINGYRAGVTGSPRYWARRRFGALVAIPLVVRQTASSASCPTRIVSISPTATESLFAIGAGNRVVAVDSDSNYPASAPRKSGLFAYSPNAEAIAFNYRPNLVVVSYDANKVVESLRRLGVRVVFQPTAKNLSAAYQQITQPRHRHVPPVRRARVVLDDAAPRSRPSGTPPTRRPAG